MNYGIPKGAGVRQRAVPGEAGNLRDEEVNRLFQGIVGSAMQLSRVIRYEIWY